MLQFCRGRTSTCTCASNVVIYVIFSNKYNSVLRFVAGTASGNDVTSSDSRASSMLFGLLNTQTRTPDNTPMLKSLLATPAQAAALPSLGTPMIVL